MLRAIRFMREWYYLFFLWEWCYEPQPSYRTIKAKACALNNVCPSTQKKIKKCLSRRMRKLVVGSAGGKEPCPGSPACSCMQVSVRHFFNLTGLAAQPANMDGTWKKIWCGFMLYQRRISNVPSCYGWCAQSKIWRECVMRGTAFCCVLGLSPSPTTAKHPKRTKNSAGRKPTTIVSDHLCSNLARIFHRTSYALRSKLGFFFSLRNALRTWRLTMGRELWKVPSVWSHLLIVRTTSLP